MKYPSKEAYVRIFYKTANCSGSAIRGWFWRELCGQQIGRSVAVSSLSANYLAGYRDTSLPISRPNNWCLILHFPHFCDVFQTFSPITNWRYVKGKQIVTEKKQKKTPNGNRKQFTNFSLKEGEKTGKTLPHGLTIFLPEGSKCQHCSIFPALKMN